MVNLEELKNSLISGKAPQVKELVQTAVDEKMSVEKILNEGLIAGMAVVVSKFKK